MALASDKVTILVIDDSDVTRNALKSFLLEYDMEVVTCNDGLEGIQKALEHKPKLIFLDIFMPNLDGLRMLKVIKVMDDLKHIPVIIISGHTDRKNVIEALEAGADRIISKPLSKDLLIKNVNDVLGEDFLSHSKKVRHLSDVEKGEIEKQLRRYFITSLPHKKMTINDAVEFRNVDLLRTVLHELKGSGSTVGFGHISELAREIEISLTGMQINWEGIKKNCDTLINYFKEIEISTTK